MQIIRSYQKFINELINLKKPFRIEIIGHVVYEKNIYPVIAVRHIVKTAKKNIIITSGNHGEEYYTIYILLKWIQQFDEKLFKMFNINIFPIINPWGYEYNQRYNYLNQDTNDSKNFIKNSQVKELSILYDFMPLNVDLSIDIHGDTGKEKCYFYERKIDTLPSLSTIAAEEVNSILPYEKSKTIYKSKVHKGVIFTPVYDEGIEAVMEKLGTEATITIELPGKCKNSQKRTEGGIAILNSILHHYSELK